MEEMSKIFIFISFLCKFSTVVSSNNLDFLKISSQFSVSFDSFKAISNFEIISARLCGWLPLAMFALILVPAHLIWSARETLYSLAIVLPKQVFQQRTLAIMSAIYFLS